MASETMVGDREAAGAIAGMQELYGLSLPDLLHTNDRHQQEIKDN